MNEQNRVDEFMKAFGLILNDDPNGFHGKDMENQNLLIFCNRLHKMDYSGESKINQSLKNQLLKRLMEQNIHNELSDDELGYAAGGLGDLGQEKDFKNKK